MVYDDANMRRALVGKYGVSPKEWSRILPELRTAKAAVLKLAKSGEQGFFDLPKDAEIRKACEKAARETRRQFTDLVVLGIGGSDLGARAINQALGGAKGKNDVRLHFAGSSTDPNQILDLLKSVNLKKTAVNVVSKSGGTMETMSAFLILRDRLKKAVGKKFAEHCIATTDPKKGVLREIAKTEGYRTLPIPSNVGGRFSVLTACGLYPAAAMGADIGKMLDGARLIARGFAAETPNQNAACRYAGLHVTGMKKRGQNIHVVMPYNARMGEFARWVRQLVAESLGKKKGRKGKTVFAGPTPVAALGPEDQHSQLQLYSEGPFDKLITMIGVARGEADVVIPRADDLPHGASRFGGHRLSDLITIERESTTESLRRNGRPTGTILLNRLDETSLGAIFMFFEITVALMAELLGVDAFDQPGVELSKKIMREKMS
jgi:glucose-6-phosphate isomerase